MFMVYSFPDGFQKGAIGVVGNIIGEEKEALGKTMVVICMIYSTLLAFAVGFWTYSYSSEIAKFYT